MPNQCNRRRKSIQIEVIKATRRRDPQLCKYQWSTTVTFHSVCIVEDKMSLQKHRVWPIWALNLTTLHDQRLRAQTMLESTRSPSKIHFKTSEFEPFVLGTTHFPILKEYFSSPQAMRISHCYFNMLLTNLLLNVTYPCNYWWVQNILHHIIWGMKWIEKSCIISFRGWNEVRNHVLYHSGDEMKWKILYYVILGMKWCEIFYINPLGKRESSSLLR